MRFKKLIAALGLSAIAASGIGVAFASGSFGKAVETKAATDDTWMFSVVAKFDVPMGWDTPGTDFQFECWGNNVNNEVFDGGIANVLERGVALVAAAWNVHCKGMALTVKNTLKWIGL